VNCIPSLNLFCASCVSYTGCSSALPYAVIALQAQFTPTAAAAAAALGSRPYSDNRSASANVAQKDTGLGSSNVTPASPGDAAASAVDIAATAVAAVAAGGGSSAAAASATPAAAAAAAAAATMTAANVTYAELAASVFKATEETLGPLSLADLVFGLQAVAKKHRQQQLKYSIQVCKQATHVCFVDLERDGGGG
jgi:hypothetical protein